MRTIIYIFFLLAPISLIIVFNCKQVQAPEPETKEFMNTLWRLESFETLDDEIIKPQDDQIYTIQFEEDLTFFGKSDCNDILGEYETGPNQSIKIIRLGTTFANCGKVSLYNKYYRAIYSLYSYEINKNKLHLYYSNGSRLNFIGQ